MKRSVKRYVAVRANGALSSGVAPQERKCDAKDGLWPGETAVLATITYDDGRPSRSGAKRTKGGRK